jgi:hypothetical protein
MDEYHERIDYDWFVVYIEGPKAPGFVNEQGRKNLQHNEYGKTNMYPYFNPQNDWDDEDGYAFTTREFS